MVYLPYVKLHLQKYRTLQTRFYTYNYLSQVVLQKIKSYSKLIYVIFAATIINMSTQYTWHEDKRLANLDKHHLDFSSADLVLENPYCWVIDSERNGEHRRQAFAYVFDVLTVLTVVFLPRIKPHIISFRPAKQSEREEYHEWLENDFNDAE